MAPSFPRTHLLALLTTCAALAGCGGDGGAKTVTDTRTVTRTETVVEPAATTCSASDLDIELPAQPDLPAPVAKTRQELFDAAVACDFAALGAVAARDADQFGYSYGADTTGPAAYWEARDAEDRTLERLARILTTPVVEVRQGPLVYAWPSVYEDAPSNTDYADLVESGAYTATEAKRFQAGGSYLGYRVGIRPDGTWSFFQTGD